MTEPIKLPPLPGYFDDFMDKSKALIFEYGQQCARAAIEADRQARGEPVKVPSENDLWPKGETRYFCDRCSMTLGAEVVLEIAKDFNPAQAIDHARRVEGEAK